MRTCQQCGQREATEQRLGRHLCARCAEQAFGPEALKAAAPALAGALVFALAVAVALPVGTLYVVRFLLHALHG